jgi:segregation and condensation protein B
MLFINESPLETKELAEVLGVSKKDIDVAAGELIKELKDHNAGMCIVKIAGGYQMCSVPENEEWVRKLYRERTKRKLSTAALETLAIIAYKQPITKMEIEAIRGVSADGVTKNLTDAGLIKIGGRKEVVGRPFLFITTRKFLEYFGLNAIKDLPKLDEFINLAKNDAIVQEMFASNKAPEENPTEERPEDQEPTQAQQLLHDFKTGAEKEDDPHPSNDEDEDDEDDEVDYSDDETDYDEDDDDDDEDDIDEEEDDNEDINKPQSSVTDNDTRQEKEVTQ